jgi:hypothetical protein
MNPEVQQSMLKFPGYLLKVLAVVAQFNKAVSSNDPRLHHLQPLLLDGLLAST